MLDECGMRITQASGSAWLSQHSKPSVSVSWLWPHVPIDPSRLSV